MRQIPSEGEYCGECPMQPAEDGYYDDCRYYVDTLKWYVGKGYFRLPKCLTEKPQVLTAKERTGLALGNAIVEILE